LSPEKEKTVKVIFIEDVPRVARVGQTRTVADGYARNYLFPRRLAVLAGSQAATAIEAQLKKKVKQRELEDAQMAELAGQIDGIEITIKAKVGENEKLYGSITSADIAGALSEAAAREIDRKKIELPEPIKQAGSSEVTVRLAHEITAVIKVNVVSEEAVEAPPEAEKPKEKKVKAAVKKKKVKKEKPAKEEEAEPVEAVKEEKPAKEKKPRKTKAEKAATAVAEAPAEEKPAPEKPPAAKKAKKPRAKAKKSGDAEEAKEES
jgi:large subunit ribosomal protein L9